MRRFALLVGAFAALASPDLSADDPPRVETHRLAAGSYSSCFVEGGVIRCWGANPDGQLGTGSKGDKVQRAVAVEGVPGATSISIGHHHACAIGAGRAYCWGSNEFSQLGSGGTRGSLTPSPVAGLTGNVDLVVAGGRHSCALSGGDVYCWGDKSILGALNMGRGLASAEAGAPSRIGGIPAGIRALVAGEEHTCALASGEVWCWGGNAKGQCGVENMSVVNVPTRVAGLPLMVNDLKTFGSTTCALAGGQVFCWGSNDKGQLAATMVEFSAKPMRIGGLPTDAFALSVGGHHVCARTPKQVWCWGADDNGQLARARWRSVVGAVKSFVSNTNYATNAQIRNLQPTPTDEFKGPVLELASGERHNCALFGDHTIRCWGANAEGELGSSEVAKHSFGRNKSFSAVPLRISGI